MECYTQQSCNALWAGQQACVLPLANPISSTETLQNTRDCCGPCASLLWLTGSTSLSYLPQLPVTYQRRRSCCNPTINAPTDPAESRLLAWRVLPRSVSPVLWEVPRLLEARPFFCASAKHRLGLFLPACSRLSASPLDRFLDWIVAHIPFPAPDSQVPETDKPKPKPCVGSPSLARRLSTLPGPPPSTLQPSNRPQACDRPCTPSAASFP